MRFRDALRAPGLGAIAEVKRRSPSAGDLRPEADPAKLAAAFERAGAAAISILVDARFGGRIEDLRAARAATSLPLLAKGFFHEAADLAPLREAGADAVLVLLSDLDDPAATRLVSAARDLGMEALVEAHDPTELDRAVALGAGVIGINARDLSTFRIDRDAQLELVSRAPADRVIVAESGIGNRAHALLAEASGADAVLVGTTLMRAADPGLALDDLLARPLVKVCGLTREEDVAAAADAGADMAGFVLSPSPRRVEAPLPVPDGLLSVAVVVGEDPAPPADLVQRYGREEDGHRSREAALFRRRREVARVADLPWEGEDPAHLERASAIVGRLMLAGGLSADNVGAAIRRVRPWAVDASRSLEAVPGRKDPALVHAFVRAAREALRREPEREEAMG